VQHLEGVVVSAVGRAAYFTSFTPVTASRFL
jgi:hypothetical protein